MIKEHYSMRKENKHFEGIYYSVFVASWNKINGGKYKRLIDNRAFRQWLRTITINDKHIPEDIIQEITTMKDDGKLELEELAKKFEYNPELDKGRYLGT